MAQIAGLWTDTTVHADHVVLHLHGTLSLATVSPVRTALDKLLGDGHAVVVDLSGVDLRWLPAAEVFPTALAAAGGWPGARMALAGADPALTGHLKALRIPRSVPLLHDTAGAALRVQHRPDRLARHRTLPRHASAPAAARDLVREAAHDWDAPSVLEVGTLVATELVTNAVVHARSTCRLTLTLDHTGLRISVRDYRPGPAPRPRPVDAAVAGGRGLHLVSLLARSWDVHLHPDGKTVWALIAPR